MRLCTTCLARAPKSNLDCEIEAAAAAAAAGWIMCCAVVTNCLNILLFGLDLILSRNRTEQNRREERRAREGGDV